MPFPDCIKLSENHLTTPRASRFIAKRQPLLCNFYWEKFQTDKFSQIIFISPMLILIINLSKSFWKDNLKISITWLNNTKKSSKKINFTTLFLDSTKSLLELVWEGFPSLTAEFHFKISDKNLTFQHKMLNLLLLKL